MTCGFPSIKVYKPEVRRKGPRSGCDLNRKISSSGLQRCSFFIMLLAYLLENEPSNWDAALIVEHVRQIPPLTPFSALQNDLYLALQDISALNSVNREKKTKAKQWLKNWKGVVNQLKQAYAGTTNQDNDSRSDSSRSSSKISIVNYGQQNFNPSNAVFINKR
ncbi:hypothetical protein BC941DRAFT_254431 [Chlamydoabsidia padenii]|nr:hypothetical protein BC941DRAFT_254431 [Chlamydoabsidia padenii]